MGTVAFNSYLQPPVVLITCPVLPTPFNGVKLGCGWNIMYYGTECHFLCNYGYAGSGFKVRRCQRNGTWTGRDFGCHATTCLALRAPTDGAVLGCPGNAGANYDTVCQFSCNSGYIGYGSQERRCQHDGTWSGKEFVCQTVTCTLPTNGVLLGCKTNTTEMSYNAECRFSCKESVEEMSPTVRICAENGSWSETDVGCTELNRLRNSSCILVTAFDRIIPLDYNNNSAFSVTSTLSYAEAVNYHYELGYMFWSDIREGNIKRSNMDGTNIKFIHKEGDSYGLVVEWNPLQLYWTNIINRSISVSDLEGKNRRVLDCSNIDEPFGIVFDPHEGMMFWTDGESRQVMKSTLEGTQCVALVASKLFRPAGITLNR
ncbi:Low-density lipoprotein receptor-related protein 2 [Stylophora pistillata]|uniref:Low-density lipoprotein receptor-related protein 2 n=1 Tax=Stylophora pistillata TaxID=50429 RepID=A0A2B4S5J0_STYPI|nr:Low-density lipoprotein receptor-related protein 2 [Stylophora pistillata]